MSNPVTVTVKVKTPAPKKKSHPPAGPIAPGDGRYNIGGLGLDVYIAFCTTNYGTDC